MARRRQVTRTFKGSKVTTVDFNAETGESEEVTRDLGVRFKDEQKLLKYMRNKYETSTTKIAHVVSYVPVNTVRTMDEGEFIENSELVETTPITEEED